MARRKSATAETVTTENFGELLIEGLQEAVDVHEGRRDPVFIRSYPLTARKAAVRPAPMLGADDIRKLRESLKLSQPVFAHALNVSPATDRAWEQAKRTPDGPSLRLLQIAQRHPAVILEYVVERRPARRASARRSAGPSSRPAARPERKVRRKAGK